MSTDITHNRVLYLCRTQIYCAAGTYTSLTWLTLELLPVVLRPEAEAGCNCAGVTSGPNVIQQQGLPKIHYNSHQQLHQISSSQPQIQNPKSPNPLIVSIQSNDSDKTLSSKF